MKARDAAASVRERLAAAGIEDAAFEAEYLVRSAAGVTRPEFFTNPDLSAAASEAVERAATRREQREPSPYITGYREFWGLRFAVGPGVLVPRPETELLVRIAIEATAGLERPAIADIGTGSGCIAVATALELPGAVVVATDVSAAALGFARANAREHSARVGFSRSHLATSLGHADVVLANLPYIATDEIDALEPEVSRWEPRVALDGGGDGFDLIRKLVEDCASRLHPRLLALEVGYGMGLAAADVGRRAGAATTLVKDFAGTDRVVCCEWE